MNAKLISLVEEQAAREVRAAQTYLSLSLWAQSAGYANAAKVIKGWGEDELHDRDKWLKYLVKYCGVLPECPACPAIHLQPDSLLSCMKQILQLELDVTTAIKKLSQSAEEAGECEFVEFIAGFLDDQIESIKRSRYNVQVLVVAAGNPSAVLHVEHRLQK